jgi:hypothetical protein
LPFAPGHVIIGHHLSMSLGHVDHSVRGISSMQLLNFLAEGLHLCRGRFWPSFQVRGSHRHPPSCFKVQNVDSRISKVRNFHHAGDLAVRKLGLD